MLDMKMALIDVKLEVVNRIGLAQVEMMRQLNHASSSLGFMSPEEYVARVAWPEDQPQSTRGGGANTYSAVDDDYE